VRDRHLRLLAGLGLLALALSATRALAGPEERFRGMPLPDALAKLAREGLAIVFSSELVKRDMIVEREPRGRWPNEILDELLAPHGLRSVPGPSGALLVVPAPRTGTIAGVVRIARSRDPIPGVRIVAGHAGVEATTDASGRFELGPLPEGRYRLDSAHPGYLARGPAEVSVRAAKATRVTLVLDPAYASEEVLVRASQTGAEDPVTRETLDRSGIGTAPQIAHDPLSGVERLPGVVATEREGGLHVRGGGSRESKIVLDGVEIRDPFHLEESGGPIGMVDSRDLGDVGILTGAFPAEHGGVLSGVIEMTTLDPGDEVSTAIALSTEDARIESRGELSDRTGWLVSARRGDPVELLEGLGADPAYSPSYWDFLVKTDTRIGSSSLSFHFLGGRDLVQGSAEDDVIRTVREPGTFQNVHGTAYGWAKLAQPVSDRLFFETVLSVGRIRLDRSGSSPRALEVHDLRSTSTLGLKQDWLFETAHGTWKWGVDLEHTSTEYEYEMVPAPGSPDLATVALAPAPSGNEIGVYVSDRIPLSGKGWLELGLRFDAQSWVPGSQGTLGPRLNAAVPIGPRSLVRIGWGLFSQPQGIDELQVEDGLAAFQATERAEHRVVSLEHELPTGVVLRASAYQKKMTDVPVRYENLYDPYGFFPEASWDRVAIAPDAARAEGFEVAALGPVGERIAWWASATLARAEDRIGSEWVPMSWDHRNALDAGLRWDLPAGFRLSLAGSYRSGRPTTPVSWTDGLAPALGARNSARLPSYRRIDASIARTFRLRGTTLEAKLTVLNLLNEANPCCVVGFESETLPDGTVTTRPVLRDGLPLFVTAGVEWRF
jgi:hypothetical protein